MGDVAARRRIWRYVAGTAVVHSIVLFSRGWGAHRIIHWEDLQFAGRAVSQPWWWNLNDQGYGILIDQTAAELASLAPIEHLSMGIFLVSSLVWLISAILVSVEVGRLSGSRLVGLLGGSALTLLPLPELAQQAQVRNVSVAVLLLACVVAVTEPRDGSLRTITSRSLLMLLIGASNPVAVMLIVPLTWHALRHRSRLSSSLPALVALCAGLFLTFIASRVAEPELAYARGFVPNTRYEENVLGRFEEVGATVVRRTDPPSVADAIRQVPGVVKFVTTQMAPEPWRSNWILPTSDARNAIRVLGLAFAFISVPLLLAAGRRSSPPSSAAGWLILLALASVAIPLLSNGSYVERGYLAYPIGLVSIAVVLVASETNRWRRWLWSRRAWLIVVALSYLASVVHDFRDPFDANPRQGGLGRYEEEDLWGRGVDVAQGECASAPDEEFVVVSQKPGEVYFDSPMVLRCEYLR